jgi:hypothetical protein
MHGGTASLDWSRIDANHLPIVLILGQSTPDTGNATAECTASEYTSSELTTEAVLLSTCKSECSTHVPAGRIIPEPGG